MDLSKYFANSEYKKVLRSEIHIADYNPRKIDAEGKKYLKRSIRQFGVLGGIVVNKRTNNTVVGGNQKVAMLDEMLKYDGTPNTDYQLVVQVVDMDLKTEKEANIALNSPRTMGYWDDEKLREIVAEDDFDYKSALLNEEDLSIIGMDDVFKTDGEDALSKDLDDLMSPIDEQRQADNEKRKEQREAIKQAQVAANAQQEAMISEEERQARIAHMKDVKQKVADSGVERAMKDEAYVMLSFDNMDNKASFMSKFGKPVTDKFLKGEEIDKMIEV